MNELDKTNLAQMLGSIQKYSTGEAGIQRALNLLDGYYQGLSDDLKNGRFQEDFHKYWDWLEEINALNCEAEFQNVITNEIIPAFCRCLQEWLDGAPPPKTPC